MIRTDSGLILLELREAGMDRIWSCGLLQFHESDNGYEQIRLSEAGNYYDYTALYTFNAMIRTQILHYLCGVVSVSLDAYGNTTEVVYVDSTLS